MTEILKSILFGVLEGITEWLPVSSTGHLILLNDFLRLRVSPEFQSMFDVVIQLGAILAVVVLYARRLNPVDPRKSAQQQYETWLLWLRVLAAILPSGVVGILFDDWMEEHLHNTTVVAAALILYGIAFLLVERRNRRREPRIRDAGEVGFGTALIIGLFQCLSLVPGTSRSGSTILGGILAGVSRSAAAEFSFFMAVPTMLGAGGIKLLKFFLSGARFSGMECAVLLTGCAVSFLVSLTVIRGMMRYVRRRSFSAFGVYRIALGAAVLLYCCNKYKIRIYRRNPYGTQGIYH